PRSRDRRVPIGDSRKLKEVFELRWRIAEEERIAPLLALALQRRKETKHARVEDERGSAGPPRSIIQELQADIAAASPSELLHLARHVRRVRSADGEEMEILVDREADRDVAP